MSTTLRNVETPLTATQPVEPGHDLTIVLVDRPEDATPDDSWSLDDLRTYALSRLNEASILARRSTAQTYRAGRALSLAKNKLKTLKAWGKWQQEHDLPRTSVWEAVELFRKAPSEEAIEHLTPQKAKEQFGIVKKRPHVGNGITRKRKGKDDPATQPRQEKTGHSTDDANDDSARDLDAIAACLGEEYREAVVSGEARLSPEETRTLVGGDGRATRSAEATGQDRIVSDSETAEETAKSASEEEPVDEELLKQATDLVRRMNHATMMTFVGQPLVLAAVRRLPSSLVAAA